MKRIAVYGKTTREKNFLMLYLSKVLSVEHKVALICQQNFYLGDLESVHYNEHFVIRKNDNNDKDIDEPCDFRIIDLVSPAPQDVMPIYDLTYLVTSSYRSDIEDNEDVIKGIETPFTVIFQNLVYDLKISTKYLCKRLKVSSKTYKIYEQYLNENDLGILMENEYDAQIDMKHLSKSYKQLLLQLILDIDMGYKNPSKKWLRKAMRKA